MREMRRDGNLMMGVAVDTQMMKVFSDREGKKAESEGKKEKRKRVNERKKGGWMSGARTFTTFFVCFRTSKKRQKDDARVWKLVQMTRIRWNYVFGNDFVAYKLKRTQENQ